MDRKSKIILYIFFFLFAWTVMFSYARYMVFRDYEVMYSASEEESVPEDESTEATPDTGDGAVE